MKCKTLQATWPLDATMKEYTVLSVATIKYCDKIIKEFILAYISML